MAFVVYPFLLLKFYFVDFPIVFVRKIQESIQYLFNLLSVPLMFKTFFQPLKSEYRQKLVLFSILVGMFIKSILLLVSIAFILIIGLVEMLFLILYILFPFFVVYLVIP